MWRSTVKQHALLRRRQRIDVFHHPRAADRLDNLFELALTDG
jgi:hypothetical protein